MRTLVWVVLVAGLSATGCSKEFRPDSGDVEGTGRDPDDGTGDVDTNGDGDSDTDPVDQFLDCRVDYEAPVPGSGGGAGDECLTEELFCGDLVRASTAGGSDVFGYGEYEDMGCISISNDWSGSERVYRFRLPAGEEATLSLHTKCGEFRLRTLNEDTCDAPGLTTTSCSVATQQVDTNVFGGFIPASNQAKTFFLIVDGADGYEGNFALEVDCQGE